MSEKLITILTSVYNKAPYLETWAFSVASQTYLDKARVIVIDDGSTDDSLAQLKKCVAKYNIPIELYVHEKNLGFLSTLVESYGMIETKYFTILDADDYWLSPYKLEKAINFLEKHEDFSMYASNYLNVNKDGRMSPAIPLNMPSQIFFTRKDSPFFQTSAAIFRNFFTPDFLTLTVEAEKNTLAPLPVVILSEICSPSNSANVFLKIRLRRLIFVMSESVAACLKLNLIFLLKRNALSSFNFILPLSVSTKTQLKCYMTPWNFIPKI